MDSPLSDLVVLDLTRALAGPIVGRLLADLGAEVIKVEPPAGDLTRAVVPRIDGMSAYFVHYNVGKRCVSIDLNTAEGTDLLLRMVEKVDVVLENYRPDVMARLGLDFETLKQHNPKIVLASVSGWGHNNQRSSDGAYASAIHAEAGVTAAVADRRGDDQPFNDPISHADVYTGLHAMAALLAAVHMRNRTGEAQAVEVSMAESMLLANDLAGIELTGQDPMEGFKAGQTWSPIFKLSNGRHVNATIDVTTNAAFEIFTKAMDRADLAADPRFAVLEDRVQHREELTAEIAAWVSQFSSAAEVEKAIGVSTIMVSEVRTVPELAATDWAEERGAFVDVAIGNGTDVTVPQAPWRFRDADSGVRADVLGFRGDHNAEVLKDLLDMGDAEIAALEEQGVISSRPPRWRT